MHEKKLTIIVPTYNRSKSLNALLQLLRDDTLNLINEIAVLVSDNASTDDTSLIIERIQQNFPNLICHRQTENIGPDKNFLFCVNKINTRWFWIIGDDDLLERGAISKIFNLLIEHEPALLYLKNKPIKSNLEKSSSKDILDIKFSVLDSRNFCSEVNVFFTYISGMIIDKTRLNSALNNNSIDRFDGTYLVQLGWTLPLLTTPGPFILIKSQWIRSQMSDSSGYNTLEVFGVNFPSIANQCLGVESNLSKIIINKTKTEYYPSLIYQNRRSNNIKKIYDDLTWLKMKSVIGYGWQYWFLLAPLHKAPLPVSNIIFFVYKVFFYLYRAARKTLQN